MEAATEKTKSNLEGKRVLLRKLGLLDAKDLYRSMRANERVKMPSLASQACSKKPASKLLQRGLRLTRLAMRLIREKLPLLGSRSEIRFGIVSKDTGRVVGVVTLRGINHPGKNAEIGFWVGKPFWGEGFATEAVGLALDFGFKELQLHRVTGWTAEENFGSRRVMEKCGFKLEGVMRDAYLLNGRRYDRLGYGILRSEYKTS